MLVDIDIIRVMLLFCFQVNHGGIRGEIPRKFIENPEEYCKDDSNDSDEEDYNNDIMELDKKAQVSIDVFQSSLEDYVSIDHRSNPNLRNILACSVFPS